MKLLLTGSSGYIGRFIAADALRRGHDIIHLCRSQPTSGPWIKFDLSKPPPKLPAAEALIHCAFDHIPGKYRGGEGDDPKGFLARNLDGSLALFKAAKAAGVKRIIFLSSRAVYDGYPASARLTEKLPLSPTSLYGQMKWQTEQQLKTLGLIDVSLRATGVYGRPFPEAPHKWETIFADFERGHDIAPRCGTELHGEDLACAVHLALTLPPDLVAGEAFNLSDIKLDYHELLNRYAQHKGLKHAAPAPVAAPEKAEMDCTKIRKLGWKPKGWAGLDSFVKSL